MNCSRPAPDPVGLYETFLPAHSWPHTWLNRAIAFCWAVEPSAVSAFSAATGGLAGGRPGDGRRRGRAMIVAAARGQEPPAEQQASAATAAKRFPTLSSLTGLAFSTHSRPSPAPSCSFPEEGAKSTGKYASLLAEQRHD